MEHHWRLLVWVAIEVHLRVQPEHLRLEGTGHSHIVEWWRVHLEVGVWEELVIIGEDVAWVLGQGTYSWHWHIE